MYTIQQYIKDTISLTNSIVIKFQDTAIFVNKRIEDYYGITINDDPTTWRYYLNINGQKHFTNTDVQIYLIENNTKVSLTKEILEQYPLTKEELLKQELYYNNLLLEYPNDIDYIKGCMYPVDMETAINAEDGTILAYNRLYVEDQELEIVNQLEDKIKSFIARWHVRAYMITDELYISSFIGTLYSVIPRMIMNLRLERIKTNQAHSFHIEHYFRSNLDIWDDIKILNKESILWLYKNLEYLISNIGKNETLNLIAKRIFETNKIGLGTYNILSIDQSIDEETGEILRHSPIMKPKPLNDYYNDEMSFTSKDTDIILKELENDIEITRNIEDQEKNDIIDSVDYKLKNIVDDKETKIIDINTIEKFDLYGNDLVKNLMDYWLYFSTNGVYTTKIEFVDPNTNITYKMTPKQGLMFMLYQISLIMGYEDKKIYEIEYDTIIDTEISYEDITKNMFDRDISEPSLTKLYDKIPNTIELIKSPDEFGNYFNKLIDLYITGRVEDSNVDNPIVTSEIKYFYRKIRKQGKVEFAGKSFKDMLLDDGIEVELGDEYDPFITILTIAEVFTNVSIDDTLELIEMLKSYTNIILKLTSYDTQVISDDIENDTLKTPYSTESLIKTNNGLINVVKGHTYPLELNETIIKARGNDFKEHFKVDYGTTPSHVQESIIDIGIMNIFNYKDFNVTFKHNAYADINRIYTNYGPEVSVLAAGILEDINAIIYSDKNPRGRIDTLDVGILVNKYKDFDLNSDSTYAEVIDQYMTEYYPNLKSIGLNGEQIIKMISSVETNNTTARVNDLGVVSYTLEPTSEEVMNVRTSPNTSVTLD